MNENTISELVTRLEAAERRALRAERRGRARALLGSSTMVLALALGSAPQAAARQLGVTLASLSAQVSALTTRAAAVEAKTRYQSVSGTSTVFSGTNVFVQSGSGTTAGAVNGLGNLIVGYGENDNGSDRSGSHNLVLGSGNGYSSYGGVVLGVGNRIVNRYASVLGGTANSASGLESVVLGGSNNMATAELSTLSGGEDNFAASRCSSVAGGFSNTVIGPYGSVAGGSSNTASGYYGAVSGGSRNSANSPNSVVGGGTGNAEARQNGWKASSTLTN